MGRDEVALCLAQAAFSNKNLRALRNFGGVALRQRKPQIIRTRRNACDFLACKNYGAGRDRHGQYTARRGASTSPSLALCSITDFSATAAAT